MTVAVTDARGVALKILAETRLGRFAETALRESPDLAGLVPADRSLVTELVYGVMRRRNRLDSIVKRCVTRSKVRIDPVVADILRMALYQLFFLDRIPDHAAVDQAVRLAKRHAGARQARFVNAILRRALREPDQVDPPPSPTTESLATYHSHPAWLVQRWLDRFGYETTLGILEHNNERPSTVARANRLKTTPEELLDLWRKAGVEAERFSPLPDALTILSPGSQVESLPGFSDGLFVIQDAASQMIGPLLCVRPGDRVLDLCAAPGLKTSHLAALARGEIDVVAVDADPSRLEDMRENLRRLGVGHVHLVQGDGGEPDFVESLGSFDRVLVDAPCSNLGVLRRSPEAKYRVRPRDLKELADRQTGILLSAADAVRPGGVLLYAVCTVTEEETEGVVHGFLKERSDFIPDPVERGEPPLPGLVSAESRFRSFPPPVGISIDGFFAARLRRRHGDNKAGNVV